MSNTIDTNATEIEQIDSRLAELRAERERIEAAAREAEASKKSRGESSEADTKVDFAAAQVHTALEESAFIPEVDKTYVRWGEFRFVSKVIQSERFHPIYIFGPSGNGKTVLVEQACARASRKYLRVQISPETDEDDLLGGFRLKDGETVFEEGPVIKAMKEGAVLLLDEIDRSSHKLICLQGILEGKPVLLKKTKEIVAPAKGFTVIATGNTDGRGSEDGRYASAIHIDDAFLERFINYIDQPWPQKSVERKIVCNHLAANGCSDDDFAERLIDWARTIRETEKAGGIDETISTRRLCHIASTYAIVGDRVESIRACVSRFGPEISENFLDLYDKIDGDEATSESVEGSTSDVEDTEDDLS